MFFESIFYWDGYHYASSFSLILSLNLLVVIAIILAGALILKVLTCIFKGRCRQQVKDQQPQQRTYLPVQYPDNNNIKQTPREKKTSCGKFCQFIINVIDILAAVCIVFSIALVSIIPSAYYGFHVFSAAPTFIIIFFFNLLCILVFTLIAGYTGKNKKVHYQDCGSRFKSVIKQHKIAYVFMAAGTIFVTVAFPLFMRDSCLCMYNKDYGVVVSSSFDEIFSTRLTRGISLDKACPEGAPCHVYATVPSTTDTAVFINAHTHYDVDEITINYDLQTYYTANTATRYSVSSSASVYKLDLEDKGKRAVHSVLLSGLTSDSLYYFEIVYDSTKQYTSTYKTLPASGSSTSFTIAFGGDVGASGSGADMIDYLTSIDPSLIVVGGDTAYDDGLHACWYSWDMYLDGFDAYFEKTGRTVPMITIVGNHDVGFNSYSSSSLKTDELPLYFYYLPQHFKVDSTTGSDLMEVPDPSDRKTYFYHLFGSAMQLGLDSAYVATYDDQVTWMNNLLTSYTSYAKFANYHVPIYPYCIEAEESETNDAAQRVVAQETIVPVFQDFSFKAVFEHHYHLFKKTYPLTDGAIDNTNGIVYFGDGNWGVEPNDCLTTGTVDSSLHETGSDERHLWIMTLDSSTYSLYPMDSTGSQFYATTSGTI